MKIIQIADKSNNKNRTIFIFVFIISLFFQSESKSQLELFNWRAYTSYLIVNDIAENMQNGNSQLYFATTGGLSIFDFNTQKFNLLNTYNGLWDNEITAIYYDENTEDIITGSASGALVLISPDLKAEVLLEIQKSNFSLKRINDLVVRENKLYIATSFGLVVYDLDKKIFIETIPKFGTFPTNTQVLKIQFADDNIYFATEAGITYGSLSSQLSDPKKWKNIELNSANKINDFLKSNGKFYLSTNNDVYEIQNDSLKLITKTQETIHNLTQRDGKIYYTTDWTIVNVSDSTYFPITAEYPLSSAYFINTDLPGSKFNSTYPLLVYKSFGMDYKQDNELVNIIPDCPSTNYFKNLNVDNNGNLLAATDRLTSRGFMIFDGTKWDNYYYEKYNKLMSNGIVSCMQALNGKYYMGSWGVGTMEMDNKSGTPEFTQYSVQNSPMSPFSGDFTIIGDIMQDKYGTLWMVNYGETTGGNLLVALDENGEFYGFENCTKPLGRYYFTIAIDGNDTKWVGSTLSDGLFYYNENGTLDNPADDFCGTIHTSQFVNLPSNQQNALAIDHNDVLWIGTPEGLGSIYNPSAIVYSQNPIVRSVKIVGSTNINDIYVDAVDNKWLATNKGVWIMNSDGSEILEYIDMTNSPLPTNLINSVTGDEESGTMYIGTDLGLYSVSTMNVKAATNYDISCYPQPFKLAENENMIIDGLAQNTEIAITSASGDLVRRISTYSKRVSWDGKDDNGNFVMTGIYFIQAQSRSGNQSAVQKVAVIGR
ncbi:MAG: hypothetical protein A2X64_11090 [Ignavibacteria bacterium GWF2_33_9]|nr:MAG: hypothetical protein A2X64_11090 [Ignavibacteria bacterium GWF2_33_9]